MADITVTAANVAYVSGTIRRGFAGATITAGQAIFKDSADGNSLKPADANVALGASAGVVGIALNGGSDGQPISYITEGVYNPGGTAVVGTVYVLSANAGGIAPASDLATGHYVVVIGTGTAANRIKVGILQAGVAVP